MVPNKLVQAGNGYAPLATVGISVVVADVEKEFPVIEYTHS
jgi:hypothetical protein